MSLSRVLAIIAIVTTGVTFASAQVEEPIRVDSTIVRLNVGVVDKRGRPITDLKQSSFEIFEDGVKQEISWFEPSAAPFSVVIMLDMSGSTLGFRQTLKQSAFRFIDALSPEDRVAVIEFYDKVNLRNDFTTNRRTIAHSIEVSNGRGKTQLYKALEFALEKLSKEKSRRKAVIVLTDGVDSTVRDQDRTTLASVSDDAVLTAIKPEANEILNRLLNRADALGVTIYPILLPTGDPGKLADPTTRQIALFKAARERMQIIANRTGGQLSTINRLEEMGRLYAQVAADLRTLYTIEYYPENSKRDGKWRSIRIAIDNPELIPRTRPGYFAK